MNRGLEFFILTSWQAHLQPLTVFCSQRPLSTADPGFLQQPLYTRRRGVGGGPDGGQGAAEDEASPLASAGGAPSPFTLQSFLHPEMHVETWRWEGSWQLV